MTTVKQAPTFGDAKTLINDADVASLGYTKDMSPQHATAVGRMEDAVRDLKDELLYDHFGNVLDGDNVDPNAPLTPKARQLYDQAFMYKEQARQLFRH